MHQIYSQMQMGQDQSGMMTMNQSLENLVKKGQIDKETAMLNSIMPEELAQILEIEIRFFCNDPHLLPARRQGGERLHFFKVF